MSRRIEPKTAGAKVALVNGATVLGFPPTPDAIVAVPSGWGGHHKGLVPEFDLEILADDATNLTLAELFAGILHDFALDDDDVDTVDFTNNELDLAAHAYATGDGPVQLTTTDTLPTGLALVTDYYVIYKDSGTIKLATSFANALAGTAVEFSDVGVGTHTIEDTASTQRLKLESVGLLGHARDGYIELTAVRGYVVRLSHTPLAVAYACKATLSAAKAVYWNLWSVVRR